VTYFRYSALYKCTYYYYYYNYSLTGAHTMMTFSMLWIQRSVSQTTFSKNVLF